MTTFPDITLKKDVSTNAKYNWYQVREDVFYSPLNLIIPEGYVTDFSSVPRILWNIIPSHGLSMTSSVLHDYMYTSRPLQDRFNLGPKARVDVERYIADRIFLENLQTSGMKKWQSWLMYLAVRLFGRKKFKKQSAEE